MIKVENTEVYGWEAAIRGMRNACQARKNHKLDEWHEFCKWAESLPYSELILEV